MVDRVVSTKLTEEEHNPLVDERNRSGFSPSHFMKMAIMEKVCPRNIQSPGNSIAVPVEERKDVAAAIHTPRKPETELEKIMRLLNQSAKSSSNKG
jgi:hypothetical protein